MKKEKIGYLGPEGTFSEMAARLLYPRGVLQPCKTIPNCMEKVAEGALDCCVVPAENAIEGSVNVTLDYLVHEFDLPIAAEIVVPIKQHLLAHPEKKESWSKAKRVYSHPQALSQCHHFIKKFLPQAETVFTDSTAAACAFIARHPGEEAVAIGNRMAQQLYQLEIIKENVHDYANNHTRFLALHRGDGCYEGARPAAKGKTTLTVTLPSDYPGALHQVLSAIMSHNSSIIKNFAF